MKSISLLLFLSLMATACEITGANDPDPAPRSLSAGEQEVVRADNAFGLELFKQVNKNAEDVIFISPLSISMALGMTLNGAAGDTYAEMQSALHKEGLSAETINQSYQSLIKLLVDLDPKVTLTIANSIWYRNDFRVMPSFTETNRTHFYAEIAALDFSDPSAKNTINNWVSENTNGRIPSIVDEIPPEAVMYLVNALYFKGSWLYSFDPDRTQPLPFHNQDQSVTETPMMQMQVTLPMAETDLFSALDLPYGDSLYSMTVLLPKVDATLSDVTESLSSENWNNLVSTFSSTKVDIRLPRFSLEYKHTLNEALQALGMSSAFDASRADFSAMHPNADLYLSRVLHKTFLEVNEEGSEAAAVTAVEVGIVSVGLDPPPVLFHVDRPFLFAIREAGSGSILFIGRVNKL